MRDDRPLKPSVLDKLISGLKGPDSGSRDSAPCPIVSIDPFTERDLREAVIRDVAWILNDINFAAAVKIEDYPEIRTSVLNQGVPDLTIDVNEGNLVRRARELAEAIRMFEPRLLAESVRVTIDSRGVDDQNKLRFTIHGELQCAVDDRYIELKTAIAVDTGEVEVAQ
jgi:type VI secretion system protein ImpF